MIHSKETPSAGGAEGMECVSLCGREHFNNSHSLRRLQVSSLTRRCAISMEYAAVVAALIYRGANDCR